MSSPIAAYALLMASFNQDIRDPLELTLPLARRAIYGWTGKSITADLLQARIENIWGLQIPQVVLRYLMPRLQSQGLLTYDTSLKQYAPDPSAVSDRDIIQQEQNARERYNGLLHRIEAVIKRESEYELSPDEVLEKWLDTSALSFLGSVRRAEHADNEDREINRIISLTLGIGGDDVNDDVAKDMAEIALGDVLYRAIRSISEYDVPDSDDEFNIIDSVNRRMSGVSVYFDIGILFRILGVGGNVLQTSSQELLEICNKTGCSTRTFQHTIEEMQEILGVVAARLHAGSNAFGDLVSFAFQHGYDSADMLALSADLPETLSALGIIIEDRPPISSHLLSIDEKALDYRLETGVRQDNPTARKRDVDSLAAIYRLRDGKAKRTLENCTAIYATHNKGLADVSTIFFQKHFRDSRETNVVQICIYDVVLAARLWIKLPTHTTALPKGQIISHAVANLRPSQRILDSFIQHLRKMAQRGTLTQEEVARVRMSRFAAQMLALHVSAKNTEIDEEQALSVVRDVILNQKKAILSIQEKSDAEIEDLERSARRAEEELERLRDTKDSEISRYKHYVRKYRREILRLKIIMRMASRVSQKSSRLIAKGLVLLVSFFVAIPIIRFIDSTYFDGSLIEGVSFLELVVAAFLSALTMWGVGMSRIQEKIELAIQRGIRRLLDTASRSDPDDQTQ